MIELELCDPGAPRSTGAAPARTAPRKALFEPAVAPSEATIDGRVRLPGSHGEHLLQCAYGTEDRVKRFYADQVLAGLNPPMIEFIGRMLDPHHAPWFPGGQGAGASAAAVEHPLQD